MTQLVSVIMPSLNMGRYIDAALRSVAAQNFCEVEIVIADAQSTDETPEIVEAWMQKGLRIQFFACPKEKPGIVRNHALARAKGDVVGFLDPDDLWPKGKLQRQLTRLQREPWIDMVTGYVRYFEQAAEDGLEPAPESRTETLFHVHLGACLYRREALDAIGHFDPEFLYAEDVDLLLRLRESGRPFSILRTVELYYRKHGGGLMGQENPRKAADFSRAAMKSLARRRQRGVAHLPLPDFKDFIE